VLVLGNAEQDDAAGGDSFRQVAPAFAAPPVQLSLLSVNAQQP
jgi:hypothetical protein